jgi:hypothetical protein
MRVKMILVFAVLVSAMIYSALSLLPAKTTAQSVSCCSINAQCAAVDTCCKSADITCDKSKKGFCVQQRNCAHPQ